MAAVTHFTRCGGGVVEKTDLDVHYSAVPQQKYTTCRGHKYDGIPATSKQAGVPYLGEKQKPNIYTYMPEGTVEFDPRVGKPQLEFYVHASVFLQGETIYKLCGRVVGSHEVVGYSDSH